MSDYTDDAPPRRAERRDRRRYDEDDYDDRPRRRSREPEQVPTPVLPLVYGVLAILFSCMGPVALALGGLAIWRANMALDELPDSRRADSARSRMNLARILGVVGMGLGAVALVGALILNFVSPRTPANDPKPPAQQQPPVQQPRPQQQPQPPQQPQQQRPQPPVQQPQNPPQKPAETPRPKGHQMVYRVTGNPTPDQQADRVKQVIGALPGVDPASVEVSDSEIRFRIAAGRELTQANDAMRKLGYQVQSTASTPLQ